MTDPLLDSENEARLLVEAAGRVEGLERKLAAALEDARGLRAVLQDPGGFCLGYVAAQRQAKAEWERAQENSDLADSLALEADAHQRRALAAEAEVARLRASPPPGGERERALEAALLDLLGIATPSSLEHVLRLMSGAVRHLMIDHNCDAHGWELVDSTRQRALDYADKAVAAHRLLLPALAAAPAQYTK